MHTPDERIKGVASLSEVEALNISKVEGIEKYVSRKTRPPDKVPRVLRRWIADVLVGSY